MFFEYQRALLVLLINSEVSLFQRWALGNKVMQSKEYRTCVINAKINCKFPSLCLYKIKLCYPLWLWGNIKAKTSKRNR